MKKNDYFDIKRFIQLIYRFLSLNYISKLIATGAVCGVLIFLSLMHMLFDGYLNPGTFSSISLTVMLILGFIFTSTGFNEINSPAKATFYLTLPASTLEKILAAWIITSVIYMVYAFSLIYIIQFVLMGINGIFMHQQFSLVNLFIPAYLKVFWLYMITQPVFLFGAAYFKGNNFLKTIFGLFLLGLFLGIYGNLMFILITGEHHNSLVYSGNLIRIRGSEISNDPFLSDATAVFKFFFHYLMIPFFLVLSFISLKERQA